MKLNDFLIRTKLTVGFGVILAIATAVCGLGIVNLSLVSARASAISSDWMPRMQALGQMNVHLADLRLTRLKLTVTDDAHPMDKAIANVEKGVLTLAEDSKAYLQRVESDEERALFQRLDAQIGTYVSSIPKQLDFARAGEIDKVAAIFNGEAGAAYGPVSETMSQLRALVDRGSQRAAAEGETVYHRGRIELIAGLAAMLLFGSGVAWRLSADLVGATRRAVGAASRMAAGDLGRPIDIEGKDELAQLARALDTMRLNLSRTFHGVLCTAQGVATASAQIASGNNDLSLRTEPHRVSRRPVGLSQTGVV